MGKFEHFPNWSTRFIAFMQTKGLYKIVIGNEDIITRSDRIPENPSDDYRAARDAQQREQKIKVEEKEILCGATWH